MAIEVTGNPIGRRHRGAAAGVPPERLQGDRLGDDRLGDDRGSDDRVLCDALGGDEAAFGRLYRSVHPGLLRYLSALVGPDADDVASETWAQACRDLGRFRGGPDDFRGWIATIGRHRALDHLRAARRRPTRALAAQDLPRGGLAPDASEGAQERIGTDAALRLIAALPQVQAEAVLLRSVLGLDAPTAAKVLGRRPGAVRTATHRGLRALAAQLSAADPERSGDGSGDTSRVRGAEQTT